ncbi:uncharacterized protein podxl2 isoform X1 [Nerophis lumbriciformis]|uniref:uncharacterized protein podxl2 isoform X1 n=2 Tax=Nerophis lumbriciformis TaxID=546530 RepID=UPI002ADF2DDB|nr:podocalyxin isoform X1 [Nerophis lumbriciformis]
MKMTTAADMTGSCLFIFITLIVFQPSLTMTSPHPQDQHQRPLQDLVSLRSQLVQRSPEQIQQKSGTKVDGRQDPPDPEGNWTRPSDLTTPQVVATEESSMEASGVFGLDADERDGGEEGGVARDRRDEWTDLHPIFKRTSATLDLDTMIGYSPSSPALDAGPRQHREQLWEEDSHSSGFGALRTSTASGIATATPPPESDTGTDFGLLGVKGEDERRLNVPVDRVDKDEDGEKQTRRPPTHVSPSGPLAEATWDWLATPPQQAQVTCVDWTQPAGHGYVILNMTHNLNCEEFRVDGGVLLLKTMERLFARRMKSPEGSWRLYLSKPTHQQRQMLMHVASEQGVISTKDLLSMLTEMRISLNKVGVQGYGKPSPCPPRPSQTRSDYSKLFVVLVIIGSVCMVIIASGFIYICWQRRPPVTKSTFRAEELHFVENGCHDNPTLDVAGDSRPVTREKTIANGLAGAGEGGGDESSRWQVFVNQAAAEEEEEEQDTHL